MTLDSILRVGISGLTTAQSVLTTTSLNIANVNTPNYSRRVVQLESQVAGANTPAFGLPRSGELLTSFLRKSCEPRRRTLSAMKRCHPYTSDCRHCSADPTKT